VFTSSVVLYYINIGDLENLFLVFKIKLKAVLLSY